MKVIGERFFGMPQLPNFGTVFATIAYWLVWNDSFIHTFEAAGIDPADMPEDLPREVIEEFLKLRESNGIQYARFKLKNAAELLRDQILREFDLEDASLLRGIYFETLEKYRSHKLQHDLARTPEKTRELVETFQAKGVGNLEAKPLSEWLNEYAEEWTKTAGEITKPRRLPGYFGISEMIGGFNPGRVTMIVADTGFGKTNLGINLALSAAEIMPALYVNMEMVPLDFTARILTARTQETNPRDLHAKQAAQSDLAQRLFISPGTDYSLPEIRGLIKTHLAKHQIQFVVIDYDQKLKLTIDRNQQEWQALQKALVAVESIAKACGLQICVLAQANEEGKVSGSRRSMFPVSAVLRFYKHDQFGPVIEAVKNRFGPRGAAYKLNYDARLCRVIEERPLDLGKRSVSEVINGFVKQA